MSMRSRRRGQSGTVQRGGVTGLLHGTEQLVRGEWLLQKRHRARRSATVSTDRSDMPVMTMIGRLHCARRRACMTPRPDSLGIRTSATSMSGRSSGSQYARQRRVMSSSPSRASSVQWPAERSTSTTRARKSSSSSATTTRIFLPVVSKVEGMEGSVVDAQARRLCLPPYGRRRSTERARSTEDNARGGRGMNGALHWTEAIR